MLPSISMIDHESDPVKAEQWMRNLKVLGLVGFGTALVWGGATLFKKMEEKSQTKAFSALATAESIEDSLLENSEVLSKDPIEVVAESDEETQTSYIASLKSVIAEHSGTSAAYLAALRLGRYHALKGQNDEAKIIYSDLREKSQSSKDSALFYAMASEALGVVLEGQKDFEGALKVYSESLEKKHTNLRPLLLLGKARVESALGMKEEATKSYEKVVSDFPSTSYSQQAQALKVKVSL